MRGISAERKLKFYQEFPLKISSSFLLFLLLPSFPPSLASFLFSSSLAERCSKFRLKTALNRVIKNYNMTHSRVYTNEQK